MNILHHPLIRPILAILLLGLTMNALKSQWSRLSRARTTGPGVVGGIDQAGGPGPGIGTGTGTGDMERRMVVAHFMLGNTYPFTDEDWLATFDLARETSLDALVLNLGPEEWQSAQAIRAYSLLSSSRHARDSSRDGVQSRGRGRGEKAERELQLFLSLDMNVLPHDPAKLAEKVIAIVSSGPSAQVLWDDRILLSTFGGHALEQGWEEVKDLIEQGLGQRVFLWPAFFMPPQDFVRLPYIDGTFTWNSAWPMGNHTTNMIEDQVFLRSDKPYMAAVSPLFFTHYGTEGEWAWNKNWIYRSDDLLLPTRFQQLLSLPPSRAPSIIQVVSWNDYGESHYIAPVRGAQPGSEAWTGDMDHDGFRWIVRYFIRRWRDGVGEVEAGFVDEDEGRIVQRDISGTPSMARTTTTTKTKARARVVMWYRTQVSDSLAQDRVGQPDHAEWAQDLINILVLISASEARTTKSHTLEIQNGPTRTTLDVQAGKLNLYTVPYTKGQVSFEVLEDERDLVVSGHGKEISDGKGLGWNYNFWSGVWAA